MTPHQYLGEEFTTYIQYTQGIMKHELMTLFASLGTSDSFYIFFIFLYGLNAFTAKMRSIK